MQFFFSKISNDGFDKKSEKKPDIKIGFKDRHRVVGCVYFEVKRPNVASKYQEEENFAKLLKQLKASLDYQVALNISSPVSFGVLCEGNVLFWFSSYIFLKVL